MEERSTGIKALHLVSAGLLTLFWMGVFPIVLSYSNVALMLFEYKQIPFWIINFLVFISMFIPLACPAAVICIWVSWYFNRIKLMWLSNLIPVAVLAIVVGTLFVVDLFFKPAA
jgi:hypothetical protein